MLKMDIKKILHDISHNEHEKFKTFKERLVKYCTDRKNAVSTLFRLLRTIEDELHECLKGVFKVNVERRIIIKVLKAIRIEIDIIRFRMKHPAHYEQQMQGFPKSVGQWTGEKAVLIELIDAIQMSVNCGRVSVKALQECFEYIFQVDLGNIDEQLKELKKRKGNKTQHLERLITHLNKVHDDLQPHKSQHKLKWTGANI